MGGGEGGGEAHGSCCVPSDGLLCCWSSLTLIYSHKSFVSFVIYRHVKDSATTAGLALRACVPRSGVCTHRTHLSILATHQGQRHDGRACPLRACVPRSGVCTSNHTHLYSRSTSKTVPRRQGLPLRSYVPRSGVCTSAPTHRAFRSASEDCATTAGLAPASVPRSCVCTSAVLPGGPHLRAAPDRGCRVPQQSLH